VFIDPFGDMEAARGRGMTWTYPAITGATADLLLVTHEHGDHNAVQMVNGVEQLRQRLGREDEVVQREGRGHERGQPFERMLGLAARRIPDAGQVALGLMRARFRVRPGRALTGDNRLLASAEGLPVHVIGMEFLAEAVTDLHSDLTEGDAFLHNDPYLGNTHPADHVILVPVFWEGQHVFTTAAKAHQADCGNAQPTTATIDFGDGSAASGTERHFGQEERR